MISRHARRNAGSQAVHGIDRMVRNVETGRFERSLSALTAAGAPLLAPLLVTMVGGMGLLAAILRREQ